MIDPFFSYGLGDYSDDFMCNSQSEYNKILISFGFNTESHSKLCNNLHELIEHYNKILDNRFQFDYDLDGMVYKVNDFKLQKRLGYISRSPRYAIAHKFPSIKAKTKINDIIIQVGRTGALTPVAILESVNIGGVIVSRATLHNQDEIIRKDIRIGDIVLVQRAGDVIPQVLEVDLKKRDNSSKVFSFPANCPICNSQIIKNEEDVVLRCSGGLGCESQLIETLKHFVSKDAFDIIGLGKKQIENFFHEGRIRSFADIFLLESNEKTSLNPLENKSGWGKKSIENLFLAINQKRIMDIDKLIYAIGIRNIGETTAKTIAKFFININNFIDFVNKYKGYENQYIIDNIEQIEFKDCKNLISIDGVGHKILFSILDFFRDERSYKMFSDLINLLTIIDFKLSNKNLPFEGKSVVFTGSLEKMSRSEAKKIAEDLGMKVLGSVSNNTDYLVAGDESGSKLKKAKELNIKILNESEWNKLISS
jgi:DNA ligase (NAD+)